MASTHDLSLHYDNGMALLVTEIIPLLSTNTDIANKWSVLFPGDVVIKYPQAAFIIVKRDERTVRYLHLIQAKDISTTYAAVQPTEASHLLAHLDGWCHLSGERNNPIATQFCCLLHDYHRLLLHRSNPATCRPLESNATHILGHVWEMKDRYQGASKRSYILSYTEAWWKPIVIAETKTCVKKACWAPKTPAWDD
jgi:hypothetical protein